MVGDPGGSTIRPVALWVRVDQNRLKLGVFVILFVAGSALLLTAALIGVPGSLIGAALWVLEDPASSGYWSDLALVAGIGLAVLFALGGLAAAVQLANAEDWVRNRFAGVEPEPGRLDGVSSALDDMALAAGLPAAPRLIVFETDSLNACAIGTNRSRPVIGVTRGFLDGLDIGEQRAVLATLVARICAGDILFGTALAALMGPLKAIQDAKNGKGAVAEACAWGADGCVSDGCGNGCGDVGGCLFDGGMDSDSAGGCLGALAMIAFAAVVVALTWVAVTVAAWVVTVWGRALQRTSYEKADAEGMLLLKEPAPMLSALGKMIASSNLMADGDPSYDGIFYAATSGVASVDRREQRRYRRLQEVLGVDGAAAPLPETEQPPPMAPPTPESD